MGGSTTTVSAETFDVTEHDGERGETSQLVDAFEVHGCRFSSRAGAASAPWLMMVPPSIVT